MGRGVCSGGGQSSLGYLFGDGDPSGASSSTPKKNASSSSSSSSSKLSSPSPSLSSSSDKKKKMPSLSVGGKNASPSNGGTSNVEPPSLDTVAAGVASTTINYRRADGRNFITDRASTKVQAAPGGNSSLGYLFGGN